jgi:hypothetical protein
MLWMRYLILRMNKDDQPPGDGGSGSDGDGGSGDGGGDDD